MTTGRRVLRNTFFLSIGQFTMLATGTIWTALLARYIGPETYGIYAYAQSILAILVLFVNFGFEHLLVRDVAQKPELSTRYLSSIMWLKFLLSILIFGGFIIYGHLRNWSGERATVIWIVTASYFLNSFGVVLISMLHAHQAMGYDTLSKTLRAILVLGIGAVAIQMGASFPVILAVILVISVLPIVLNAFFARKLISGTGEVLHSGGSVPQIQQASGNNAKAQVAFRLLLSSIPFAALSLIAVLYSNVIILLLQNLTHNDFMVGNFAAAQRIYSMISILPSMVQNAIFPALSKVYAESIDKFRSIFEKSYRYMLVITLPMAIGLWITAPEVVYLVYGKEFVMAVSALRIMSLCLINGVGYITGSAMVAMGRQTLSAMIFGTSLVGVTVVGYLTIPQWGADGACWAMVAGNVMGFVIYTYLLFRWLNLRFPWLWTAKTAVASIAMGVIVLILKSYLNFMIVSFLIAPPVYLFLHRQLRTFSSEDHRQLLRLIPERLSRMIPLRGAVR